jgi:hypothetical protein
METDEIIHLRTIEPTLHPTISANPGIAGIGKANVYPGKMPASSALKGPRRALGDGRGRWPALTPDSPRS